jgi:5-methylcytosine-specific restriction endonuclease McrA
MSEDRGEATGRRKRIAMSKTVQLSVFRRDTWLCHLCGLPVVLAPAMRLLDLFIRDRGHAGPLAYHHSNWSRRHSPLLDHLGAAVDHVVAFSKDGAHGEENFTTSCNKCNTRKNAATVPLCTQLETLSERRVKAYLPRRPEAARGPPPPRL